MATQDDELLSVLQDLLRQHKFEVGRAISAHTEWKARLVKCVSDGHCDATAVEALRDDHCELGRWLYHLPVETRAERAWSFVRDMHANFHREASEIVALVHAGDLAGARLALASGAPFDLASRKLLEMLEDWRAAA